MTRKAHVRPTVLNVTLRKIDYDLWLIFPDEAVEAVNLKEGETLNLTEAPDGGYLLSRAKPEEDKP